MCNQDPSVASIVRECVGFLNAADTEFQKRSAIAPLLSQKISQKILLQKILSQIQDSRYTFLRFNTQDIPFSDSIRNLMLELLSAVLQIALVLSEKMKSQSVIRMFSEHSFGISNLVLKFLPVFGSVSS